MCVYIADDRDEWQPCQLLVNVGSVPRQRFQVFELERVPRQHQQGPWKAWLANWGAPLRLIQLLWDAKQKKSEPKI